MREVEGARDMLKPARGDLRALRAMQNIPSIEDRIFGFHAQQAIEKSLKAWLTLLRQRYPLTPNIIALVALLEKAGADVSEFLPLARYSSFAVQFRYDQFQDMGDALDRAAVVAEVMKIVEHVELVIEMSKST